MRTFENKEEYKKWQTSFQSNETQGMLSLAVTNRIIDFMDLPKSKKRIAKSFMRQVALVASPKKIPKNEILKTLDILIVSCAGNVKQSASENRLKAFK